MADESVDEPRQFERVLTRLDALMRRNHSAPAAGQGHEGDEMDALGSATMFMPVAEDLAEMVPVLTDVFQGSELRQVDVVESELPPVLTQPVALEPHADMASQAGSEEMPVHPAGLSEADLEKMIEDLMPHLREVMVRVMQEEFAQVQHVLQSRLMLEAERLLRHRVQQQLIPK